MPKKILIVKLSAIGDVVLTLPAAQAIRRAEPGARLTWLVGRAAAPLLERQPEVDEYLITDEAIFWTKQAKPLFELFLTLRRQRFDGVYIFHWSRWFHFFFWLMGIPQRFGFARDGKSFALTRAEPYREADARRHDVDQYARIVTGASMLSSANRRPTLRFGEEEAEALQDLWREAGLPAEGLFITMAPGGGHNTKLFMPAKRWPIERFAALANFLTEKEKAILIFLGDASEASLIAPLIKPGRISWAGRRSLRETALTIQKSRLFIGNDSGLLHIAGAVRTPSLSFFGPTSPHGKTAEWTAHRILYRNESCSPCYKYGEAPPCPYALKCMTGITAEEAYANVLELLK